MANSKCDQYETPIDMLPDEVLNMIFNRINFHGHLRLSGVCSHWKNLVQNDSFFMNTVKLDVDKMMRTRNCYPLRSYKHIRFSGDIAQNDLFRFEGHESILQTVETIRFGVLHRFDKSNFVDRIMPLCPRLKEIYITSSFSYNVDSATGLQFMDVNDFSIKISMTDYSAGFFDRLDEVLKISRPALLDNLEKQEFVAKYSGVINSLPLEHLSIRKANGYGFHFAKASEDAATESFFKKLAPSLKSISLGNDDDLDYHFMDPVRMLLTNLEKIQIKFVPLSNLDLNKFKVLPRLQCLDYEIHDETSRGHWDYFQLCVGELATLTELNVKITFLGNRKVIPTLRIKSWCQPMAAMEKLKIFGFELDIQTLEQIARTMPRLKVLDIDDLYRPKRQRWPGAADQFNKMKHLESLSECTLTFLTKNCLKKLSLPKLRHLKMYIAGGGRQRKMRTPIRQSTLDKLAANCPKLLRFFGTSFYTEEETTFMFAQRLNAVAKFCKVRPVRKDGAELKFDYDSVESCSSDDDSSSLMNVEYPNWTVELL